MEANVARTIHINNVTVLGTGNLGSQIAYQTAREASHAFLARDPSEIVSDGDSQSSQTQVTNCIQ